MALSTRSSVYIFNGLYDKVKGYIFELNDKEHINHPIIHYHHHPPPLTPTYAVKLIMWDFTLATFLSNL